MERHYLKTVLSGPGIKSGLLYRGRVIGVNGEELQAELTGDKILILIPAS